MEQFCSRRKASFNCVVCCTWSFGQHTYLTEINKINLILWNLKQRDHNTHKYLASGVYKLPRAECNNAYVGQTSSGFTTRFKEHLGLFINNYFISKFAQTLLENGQHYGILKNHEYGQGPREEYCICMLHIIVRTVQCSVGRYF